MNILYQIRLFGLLLIIKIAIFKSWLLVGTNWYQLYDLDQPKKKIKSQFLYIMKNLKINYDIKRNQKIVITDLNYRFLFVLQDTPLSPNLSPYRNQTLKTNFSKSLRQKLKLNKFSYLVNHALSEYNFTFNFCRLVLEKLVFIV